MVVGVEDRLERRGFRLGRQHDLKRLPHRSAELGVDDEHAFSLGTPHVAENFSDGDVHTRPQFSPVTLRTRSSHNSASGRCCSLPQLGHTSGPSSKHSSQAVHTARFRSGTGTRATTRRTELTTMTPWKEQTRYQTAEVGPPSLLFTEKTET